MWDDNDAYKAAIFVLLVVAFVAGLASWNCGKNETAQSPRAAWKLYVEAQEWVKQQ